MASGMLAAFIYDEVRQPAGRCWWGRRALLVGQQGAAGGGFPACALAADGGDPGRRVGTPREQRHTRREPACPPPAPAWPLPPQPMMQWMDRLTDCSFK